MVRVMLSLTIRVTETFHKMGSIKLILTMVISPVLQETARNVDQLVLMSILENNEGIQESKQEVSWDRWEWVPKKGLKTKRLNIVTKYGTKNELIEQYLADLKEMSYHLFSCHWNYN